MCQPYAQIPNAIAAKTLRTVTMTRRIFGRAAVYPRIESGRNRRRLSLAAQEAFAAAIVGCMADRIDA